MHEKAVDLVIGSFFAVIGTTGAAFHFWAVVGNITVVVLNIILALFGIYLMYLRTKKTQGEISDDEDARAERDKAKHNGPPEPL